MACFLLTNSHKILDFFFLGEEKETKDLRREERDSPGALTRIFRFIFASAEQETFFISLAPKPTGVLPLLTSTTTRTTMMIMQVCAETGVADTISKLTPITSEIEKLDLHKHYLHYFDSLKNSSDRLKENFGILDVIHFLCLWDLINWMCQCLPLFYNAFWNKNKKTVFLISSRDI